MTVVIFLLVLAVLIFVHELGHFLAAKLSGIRVDEFSIGFPPRIFSWQGKSTKYSIGMIPFGGYVKIYGENPDEKITNAPDSYRAFSSKPRFIQAIVLLAGVVFNWIFAWFLISLIFIIGANKLPVDIAIPAENIKDHKLLVVEVVPNSPAALAGIPAESEIQGFKDNGVFVPVSDIDAFRGYTNTHDVVTIVTKEGEYTITPQDGVNGKTIGVQLTTTGTVQMPWYKAIWFGLKATASITWMMISQLWQLLSQAIQGNGNWDQVSGPVGIAKVLGDGAREGFGILAMFTAFISINLAIINLIPIPALDGGRLLFVLVESIIRRPISAVIQNRANLIGFALLMLLMLVVTVKDVMKL